MTSHSPTQPDTEFTCSHCDRRFSYEAESWLGVYVKHLLADHRFGGGKLTPEEIERVCFGPL